VRQTDPSRIAARASWISLLSSSSTLICCTLPALFVALGAGAGLIVVTSAFPQLVWLSAHKEIVFALAALMLGFAGALQWRARFAPCPTDAALARACMRTRAQSRWIYLFSVAVFLVGAVFAFVLPFLMGIE
jgi:hypothetical protein